MAGCIEWAGRRRKDGYGEFGRHEKAHRAAYEAAYGPIPAGLHVLHACDNPPCVNPAHLFLGTQADNNRDMAAKGRHVSPWAQQTHCAHGHELTPENTYQRKDRTGRLCRVCRNEATRRYKARKVAI